MKVQDYLNSYKGQRAVSDLAHRIHNETRKAFEDCRQIAVAKVTERFESFNPYGIHA